MEIRDVLAAERNGLADVLDGLTAEQWATPSLSAGWTVSHVVAHLVMPFRYRSSRIVWRLIRARGDFAAVADDIAQTDAALPARELVGCLRDNARHPYTPPGAGFEAPLTDLTVHHYDICRPLGIDRAVSPEAMRVVLDTATSPRSLKHFGVSTSGLQLRPTDLEWSYGSGAAVIGPAADLLLAVCGRPAGLRGLSGDGAPILAGQLGVPA